MQYTHARAQTQTVDLARVELSARSQCFMPLIKDLYPYLQVVFYRMSVANAAIELSLSAGWLSTPLAFCALLAHASPCLEYFLAIF